MKTLTPAEIWTAVLAAISAFILICNGVEKVVKAVQIARSPNVKQDERLSSLEKWRESVDTKLASDKKHLDTIDEGNRATQRALLALLDHGIDGNNIAQMQTAKEELQNHLINR